jgi:transcriptional regulator
MGSDSQRSGRGTIVKMRRMRMNPAYESDDPGVVERLIRENPWAILVSSGDRGPVASHLPIMLDEDAPSLTIVTHLGRPDDESHSLGEEALVIVQGRHGYVSPSWCPPDSRGVPTWNFSVAHCYGVPEIMAEGENLRWLARLVERFEREVEEPALLDPDRDAPVARGTVGIRLPVSRFLCKRKLSQGKGAATRRRIIDALRRPGPYCNPDLAGDMGREEDMELGDARLDPLDG